MCDGCDGQTDGGRTTGTPDIETALLHSQVPASARLGGWRRKKRGLASVQFILVCQPPRTDLRLHLFFTLGGGKLTQLLIPSPPRCFLDVLVQLLICLGREWKGRERGEGRNSVELGRGGMVVVPEGRQIDT